MFTIYDLALMLELGLGLTIRVRGPPGRIVRGHWVRIGARVYS